MNTSPAMAFFPSDVAALLLVFCHASKAPISLKHLQCFVCPPLPAVFSWTLMWRAIWCVVRLMLLPPSLSPHIGRLSLKFSERTRTTTCMLPVVWRLKSNLPRKRFRCFGKVSGGHFKGRTHNCSDQGFFVFFPCTDDLRFVWLGILALRVNSDQEMTSI